MDDSELRQITRDSLFVMADLRIDGLEGEHRIRVRNLSSGGLMAEGAFKVRRGQDIWVNVRNIGWVEGTVAWVHETRFGIAFRDEVDPRVARATSSAADGATQLVRSPFAATDPGSLRKL